MRKIKILTAVAVFVGAAGLALADDGQSFTSPESRQQAVAADTMKQKISDLGYDVQRLKIDDGVFKVRIVEREHGGAVKGIFSTENGELLKARLAD